MQRGQGIRRRRRAFLLIGAAALAQLMLAMPLLVTNDDDGGANVETAASSDTPPSTGAPVTLVGVDPPATTAPSTTVLTSTTVLSPVSTGPPPACRNSEDPRCGPFRWEPAPGPNGDAQASMSHSPTSPRAGEPVRFTLRGTDPDAAETRVWSGPCVTPNPGGSCPTTPTARACDPHGPWTPPARRALNREEVWTLTFPDPGTYHVTFTLQSQSHPCPKVDPYGSPATTQLDIVVQPA